MALRTRKPTGRVAYPLLLVEGPEKVGKTYASLSLSADERIGRAFLFDFGEGSGDEYAPLGDYEIVEHNGTYSDFMSQLDAACSEPRVDPDLPNVIVVDSITGLWEALKVWAEKRARSSKRGRTILADDPDAEIDVSMNLWTDANDRWGRMLNRLRAWDGIAVLIARSGEVAKVGANGAPIAGQTEYRVQAQKSTPFAVSAQVRMSAPHQATLIAARSLAVDVPEKGIALPDDAPLAHVVFEVLGAGGEWQVSTAVHAQFGRRAVDVKRELVDAFLERGASEGDAKQAAAALWSSGPCAGLGRDDEVSDADHDALLALLPEPEATDA